MSFIYKKCANCHQSNGDLKLLPCSHVFCEECLRRHLVTGGFDRLCYFPCPLCKLGISVPSGGLHNFPSHPYKDLTQTFNKVDTPPLVLQPSSPRKLTHVPQMYNPTSVCCTEDDFIVISDSKKSTFFIYDLNERLISSFSIKEKIFACLYTNFHSIFITNGEYHSPLVLEYSLNGVRLTSRPMMNKMESTHGVCLLTNPQQIVVSSVETSSLYIIGDRGKLVNRINGKALLGHPFYIASTPQNDIVISDHLNNCLKVLDRTGKLKSTISSVGTGPDNLYEPMGIFVDGSNVLVADSGTRSVKSFKTSGKFNYILFQARSPERPIGVALTSDKENIVVLLIGGIQPRFIVKNYEDLKCSAPVSCV